MSALAWVLGGGGLLGGALRAALGARGATLFEAAAPAPWTEPAAFAAFADAAARAFAAQVQAQARAHAHNNRWVVAWAAGRGTFGSGAEDMAADTVLLASLLRALAAAPGLRERPGALAFASSAGGVYGGSTEETITERSAPSPTAAYGAEKLRQEALVTDWARGMPGVAALLARISTLYGEGQARSKRQGLISHIARSILRHQPVHIFVPLDTMRDYLHVGDAARDIALTLDALRATSGVTTKIVASEQPTTVAQIIGTFQQIVRRMPGVITSAHPLGTHYPHRLCFRSVVLPEAKDPHRTSLLVGIASVMAHERLALAAAAGGW